MAAPAVELEVEGRVVRVSNPDKVYFRKRKETKLDLVQYYLSVGDGIVRALRDRPTYLKRHPDGAEPPTRSTRSASPRSGPSGSRPCA